MRIDRRFAPVILLLASLAACGAPIGGGSPPPGDGTPATATITATGGSVAATDADGATLTLQVPPGAVRGEVDVTLTPRAPRDGALASFDLQPAGYRFFAPVTVELTLPAGADPTGAIFQITRSGVAMALPTDHDAAARRATATLRYLGFPTTSAASAAIGTADTDDTTESAAEVDVAPVECSVLLRQTSEQRAVANAYYTPSQPDFPEFGTDGIRIAGHATALVALGLAAERACTGESEANWEAERERLQNEACAGLFDVRITATQYNPTIGFGNDRDFANLATSLLVWRAVADLAGGDCPTEPPLDEPLTELFDKKIAHDAAIIDQMRVDDETWRNAWRAALPGFDLMADAEELGLPEVAARAHVELVERTLVRLREGALAECRENGLQSLLVDLATIGAHYGPPFGVDDLTDIAPFNANAVLRDVQYCGGLLTVRAFDEIGDPIATALLGDVPSEADYVTEATLAVPRDGAIDLRGPLPAFACYKPRAYERTAEDELVLRVNGVEHTRFLASARSFLASVADIPVADMLETAGLDEALSAHTLDLTIVREGDACGGDYGTDPTTLFEITLEVGPPTVVVVAVEGRSSVQGRGSVIDSFRDDTGVVAFDAAPVFVSASAAGEGSDFYQDETKYMQESSSASGSITHTATAGIEGDAFVLASTTTGSTTAQVTSLCIDYDEDGGVEYSGPCSIEAEIDGWATSRFEFEVASAHAYTWTASGVGELNGPVGGLQLRRLAPDDEMLEFVRTVVGVDAPVSLSGTLSPGRYAIWVSVVGSAWACDGTPQGCAPEPSQTSDSTSVDLTTRLELRPAPPAP